MSNSFLSSFLLIAMTCSIAYATDIYKYKDANGKWVFSDKKPVNTKQIEKVKYKVRKNNAPRPKIYIQKNKQKYLLIIKNPFHAPIEIEYNTPIYEGAPLRQVVAAATTTVVYEGKKKIPLFRYRWVLGDPDSKEDKYQYQFPVASKQSYKITQSFRGKFSHKKRPNIYAVDISMRFGTYISAARGGTVVWVKDDYHLGGKKAYFLDKANYVKVLHKDGTYAVYAHILLGSSLVKPGDKVDTGDIIARSGSSGFSSGPHLHFVIRKNAGFKTVSVPFEFIDNKGNSFKPKRGMNVAGNLGNSQ